MHASILVVGLVSIAAAATITVTSTTDVTVTSCAPTVTNCPGKYGSQWEVVSSPPAPAPTPSPKPTPPTDDCIDDEAGWAEWTNANGCPAYTETAPPSWISHLPPAEYSSMATKWTTGPPADWCSYSYTTAVAVATSTAVGTGGYKPSTSVVLPTYTGAADRNGAGSIGLAGLAAIVALGFA